MDLNAIYKDNKLYKVAEPLLKEDNQALSLPDGFNGVAVLFEYNEAADLDSARSVFLSKVIEAGMKLNPSQVLLANICYSNASLQKLSDLNATKVVIFSTNWLNQLINANIQKNEIVKLYGMNVMATDTLDIINTNDAAKKAFWLELKKLF